jgi:hypothetical protein
VASETALEFEEVSSVGLSGKDMAEMIEGTHEATLAWGVHVPSEMATVTPESGMSSVTVEIEIVPGSVILADLEEKVSDSNGDEPLSGEIGTAPCRDELRMDTLVTVVTENGALKETFPAMFSTVDGVFMTTQIEMPEELEGTFSVDVSELPNGAHHERLTISFVLGTMSGELSGSVESSDAEVATSAGALYGRFPAEGCEYGYLIDAESGWVTELEATLAAASEFDFSWDGGSSTTMSLSSTLGQVCYQVSPYETETTLTVELLTEVTTADDSITGTWDLTADVSVGPDGSLTTVSVYRNDYLGLSYPADEFGAQTGITGVSSDADELSYQFGFVIQPGGAPAYGSIAVIELIVPECAQPGYQPEVVEGPDGEQSSPGCQGIDSTEIQTGTLAEVVAPEPQ